MKKKSVCISHVRTSDSSFSDNVVANLQRQIDANKTAIADKVNKTDKATTELAIAGADDNTWMTPEKTKNAIGTQVPIILKSQWKTLINSTVNLPSKALGTQTENVYGTIGLDNIPISRILNAKKLHVCYSLSGNLTITTGSGYLNYLSLEGLWGILVSEATIGNGSIRLMGSSLSSNSSITLSLDNKKVINEYPIYFQVRQYENEALCLLCPYGVLVDRIVNPNTDMFPYTNFYIGPVSQNVGVSGGRVNLVAHYKEDI